jgi:GNAT superfamily N-acetyltransferase
MRTHTKQPAPMDTAKFVRAILERSRWPEAQLQDLVIRYTCHDSIGRLDQSDELVPWTATLELPFYDEDGGTAEPVVIATATYYSFDVLDSRWDPNDVLDAHSADSAVYRNLFDSEGNLLDELTLGGSCSRLVIMDRVSVDRDWRGQRFGPFLAARALRNLSGDDTIAACYPAPFELPLDHLHREREQARLGRIWEHLGFRHYRDGVFVCDPTAGELDSALDELTKVVLG